MSKINRYIYLQVLSTALFVSGVLCATVVLVQSLRLLDLIVNRGLSLFSFAWMVMLMTPRLLSYMLPITVFIAILTCYRRLSAESELVVMKGMGFSDWKLQYPALLVALTLTLLGYALNLWIVPMSHARLSEEIIKNKSNWSTAIVQEGKYMNLGNRVTRGLRCQG